ncbi:GNAT family N-acetyltransferase [Actinotalea sp. AC32]|nr:GNAT family N-acetyltransferase [Actinotalea sp. AC32]
MTTHPASGGPARVVAPVVAGAPATAPGAPPAPASAVPPVEVEVATWRPVRVVDVDGWAVGVSGGFTRRANSVVASVDVPDVGRALDAAEEVYARAGLPAVVRVCPATRPHGLDDVLARRGYAVAARTLLMTRDLGRDLGQVGATSTRSAPDGDPAAPAAHGGDPAAPAAPDGTLALTTADAPDGAWLRGWLDVKASSGGVDLALARAVVSGAPASYVTARDDHGVVGVVRVAVRDGWAAVSCLMVASRARRRGVASALTAEATAVAGAQGARRAFVQVEEGNAVARSLYERLGFATVGAYHYRERP